MAVCQATSCLSLLRVGRPEWWLWALFCGSGLRKSFERCSRSQIRFQTTAWFLGPAGATGQLVHLAGLDSSKAAAKWSVKCCSSLQFYARERRGPLARAARFIRRASPRSGSCGPNGLQTGHTPPATQKRRSSLFNFRDLSHEGPIKLPSTTSRVSLTIVIVTD